MSLQPKRESALNLPLKGSVGSFKVGTGRAGQTSLEVKYFLTHIGLDFASGSNDAVLNHMAPVRELFNFEELDFDEIMQRDIDDARVSLELIPYLLDSKSADLIKLFPPIVVVVLPVREQENRPADLYPQMFADTKPEENGEAGQYTLRSGVIGKEVFQFEQPIMDGEHLAHDLVLFRLNTNKTRLVIVDGQHRAMALLALYRNLKDQWSDAKRAPFREYYAEWTPKYIQEFKLTEINLPVMFCTFPDLAEGYEGDFNLKMAARQIFLTLNKTARKVSNSRNTLLDDNDLIAYLLRRCLSTIKRKDERSAHSLRIFNVELDQFEDRMRVTTPIALTGVNHVYYMIEHLMLNDKDGDVSGAKPRSGKFFKRQDLDSYGLIRRLDGRNLLGAEVADTTRRKTFSMSAAEKLGDNFDQRYGRFIVAAYERFKPFDCHSRAVISLETRLETHEDRKLRPILFEGQGISRVFEAHRENLKQRLDNNEFETDVPKIEELNRNLNATKMRMESALEGYRLDRATRYLDTVSDKGKLRIDGELHPSITKFFNWFYDNTLTTVAFQTALVCTFFGELERAERQIREQSASGIDTDAFFEEYLRLLNEFFIPTRTTQFKRLLRVFVGEPDGEINEWRIANSRHTFRQIVYRGEMQPDQWPKYKYLLLEIWRPENEALKASIDGERIRCRAQVFKSLHELYQKEYLLDHTRNLDDLEREDHAAIFDQTCEAFKEFLKIINGVNDIPRKREMKHLLEGTWEDTLSTNGDEDEWDEFES